MEEILQLVDGILWLQVGKIHYFYGHFQLLFVSSPLVYQGCPIILVDNMMSHYVSDRCLLPSTALTGHADYCCLAGAPCWRRGPAPFQGAKTDGKLGIFYGKPMENPMENLWKILVNHGKPMENPMENLDKSSQFIDNSSKNELFSSKIY